MIKAPAASDSLCVLIDVQEKLCGAIPSIKETSPRISLMLSASKILGIKTIVNEQYPKGLGSTIPELKEILLPEWPVIEKNSFSSFGSDNFRVEIAKKRTDNLIIMGIEAHVCVQQTVFDALEKGFNVFVPADAIASRKEYDKNISVELMRQAGAYITTVESLLFMLLKDSSNPAFKPVTKLLK